LFQTSEAKPSTTNAGAQALRKVCPATRNFEQFEAVPGIEAVMNVELWISLVTCPDNMSSVQNPFSTFFDLGSTPQL
jgi:hypothetical protein